ncbi:MAG TPA: EamA family transporter [Nitrososphaerales archaeon]|nr:EamA family transporter [Nitrososphaerales archaeon]
MESGPERLVLVALAVQVILAGANFVAVRFSNLELPPFWGASLRFLFAGLIFLAVVGLRRIELPRGRALEGVLIYGVLSFGVSYAFAYYALVSVNAGLASVVFSMVPITTLFLAGVQKQERLELRGLGGGLIAIAGTAVVFNEQLTLAIPLAALLALTGSVVAVAETSVVLKHFPRANPYATNAVGMLIGAAMLVAISLIAQETWSLPSKIPTIISVAYLVVPGSVFLFALYLYVISKWTASATNYGFVLIPLVTVLVGSVLAGETVTLTFLAGTALVLVGVYLGAISRT